MKSVSLLAPEIFQHRNFARYLSARFLSSIAVQMQSVAIGWQVYDWTGNVLDLGFVGLAQFLPFCLLVLPAGQVADRVDRHRIVSACTAINLLCSIALFALTQAQWREVAPIFAVLVAFGAARAFSMPASQAILINLVPAAAFGRAVAINSSAFHVAVITGPLLGGLLYLWGPLVVYATAATLFAVSASLMVAIRLPRRVAATEPASWRGALQGLSFVFSRPVMLGAISLDLFAVLFGGATALLPAMAKDVLQAGPTALGLLRCSPALGAAVMTGLLATWPITRHVGRYMFGGVAVFGVATIAFGLSRWLPLSVAALAIMGAGDMVSVYIRHILVQSQTPDEIRGRVSAVSAVFIGASNELGEFESGLAAGLFGLVPAVVIGGAATLVVAGAWMLGFSGLRTMDRFPPVLEKPLRDSSSP